jgi:hypothetical protein
MYISKVEEKVLVIFITENDGEKSGNLSFWIG